MKPISYLILAGLLLAAFTVPLAWGQDDTYFINSEALGTHERPLVKFDHKQHSEWLEDACVSCHHDYNENLGMSDSDGAACADCHEAEPTEDNRVDLLTAYHKRCKDCHQSLFDKGKTAAPIMCGQCHNLNNKPPEE
jgi:hypothetical protein